VVEMKKHYKTFIQCGILINCVFIFLTDILIFTNRDKWMAMLGPIIIFNVIQWIGIPISGWAFIDEELGK
jgi:hypothetical protein